MVYAVVLRSDGIIAEATVIVMSYRALYMQGKKVIVMAVAYTSWYPNLFLLTMRTGLDGTGSTFSLNL
jgi:hypothetical protein